MLVNITKNNFFFTLTLAQTDCGPGQNVGDQGGHQSRLGRHVCSPEALFVKVREVCVSRTAVATPDGRGLRNRYKAPAYYGDTAYRAVVHLG